MWRKFLNRAHCHGKLRRSNATPNPEYHQSIAESDIQTIGIIIILFRSPNSADFFFFSLFSFTIVLVIKVLYIVKVIDLKCLFLVFGRVLKS